jgi:hypothetical protein
VPATNFPNGLTALGVSTLSGVSPGSGQVFFLDDSSVYDGNDALHGTESSAPYSTIAYAMAQTTAGHGDVIIVGTGHSESLATMLAAGLTKNTTTVVALKFGASWTVGASGNVQAPAVEQLVTRAPAAVPATTTTTIFTVVGGPVRVTELYGVVTTAIANTACTVVFTTNATGLSAVTISGASASIASAAVGTTISITGVLATAAALTADQTHLAQASGIFVGPGTIAITTSGSPATGQIAFYCRYMPLSPGAAVIAA